MVSRSDLIRMIKERSNMETSNYVSKPQLIDFINAGHSELYDLVASLHASLLAVKTTLDVKRNGVASLPVDFYRLYHPTSARIRPMNYDLIGHEIEFYSLQERKVDIYYIPIVSFLASDTDTLNYPLDGWYEYIVLVGSMLSLAKEESDFSALQSRKQTLIERIHMFKPSIDQPKKVFNTRKKRREWDECI